MKQAAGGEDRGFDRLVARELSRRQAGRPLEACPQTELLAAWFDRSLEGEESAAVERHVASCERCQALAAALARTEPEVIYAQPRRLEARAWTWHLRWLAPAAAAVAVVAIGLTVATLRGPAPVQQAVRVDKPLAEAQPSAPLTAVPAEPAPSAGLPASPASRQGPPPSSKPGSTSFKVALGGQPGTMAAKTEPRAAEPAAPSDAEKGAATGAAKAKEDSRATELTFARAEAANEAAPPPPAEARPAAPTPKPVRLRDAAAARPTTQSVSATAGAPGFTSGGQVGWRPDRPGVILRTDDGGAVWSEQPLPVSVRLVAVSAVSPSVCWAVGDGVVLRTTDGHIWHALSSPVATGLVAVVARGEAAAIVRTADGSTYETTDAGSSWRKR